MVSCLAHHVVQLGSVSHVLPPQLPQHPGSFAPLICPRNVAQPHMQHVEDRGGGGCWRGAEGSWRVSQPACVTLWAADWRTGFWRKAGLWLEASSPPWALLPQPLAQFSGKSASLSSANLCALLWELRLLFTSILAFTPMLGHRGGFTGGSRVKNPPAMQETQVWSLSGKIPCRRK